jgi:AI-2 transport protein TqsA
VIDPNADAVPRWLLPRGLIVLLGMTGLLVSVLALQQFASILAPVLLALVLVIGVHPLTGILRRRGVPLWLAVTVTLIAVVALILGLAAAVALSVARLATILPTYQDSFNQLVDDLRSGLASLGVGRDQIRAALDRISFSSIASLLGGVLAGLAGIFSNLLFLLFVVVFMALDAVGFSGRLSRARRQRADVVGALDTFVRGTRSYLGGLDGVRADRGGHRRRLPLAGRGAATAAVGTAGLHHELHPQCRVHHRGGPPGSAGLARGRTPADGLS